MLAKDLMHIMNVQTLVLIYLMLFRRTLRAASQDIALARGFMERLPMFALERQVFTFLQLYQLSSLLSYHHYIIVWTA